MTDQLVLLSDQRLLVVAGINLLEHLQSQFPLPPNPHEWVGPASQAYTQMLSSIAADCGAIFGALHAAKADLDAAIDSAGICQ